MMSKGLLLLLGIAVAASGFTQEPTAAAAGGGWFYADVETNAPFAPAQVVAGSTDFKNLPFVLAGVARTSKISNRSRAQLLAVALTFEPDHRLAFLTKPRKAACLAACRSTDRWKPSLGRFLS